MQNNFQNHTSQIKQFNNQKLLSQIKQLNNENLLSQTKLLVQKERDIHIQVLSYLAEIDSRKLYFRRGFSSLFDYTVRELGYSEGAAYRRIKAMKLCRDMPETESRLQSGRLSLSTACQLQVFFEKQTKKSRKEEKQSLLLKASENALTSAEKWEFKSKTAAETVTSAPKQEQKTGVFKQSGFGNESQKQQKSEEKPTSYQFLSQEEKKSLVKRAEGCSTRATAKLLSETDPSLSLPQEKIRFLGKGKMEIKVVIDEECHKRLEELKNLLSHKNPVLSYGKLLSILSEEGLRKHDPRKRNIRQRNQKTQRKVSVAKEEEKAKERESISTSAEKHKINKISRTIPSGLRKYIWEKDGGQCTYVDHKTNCRCSSKRFLQIDHIQPFAMGGETEKKNLRLLCAGHNQYRR